MRIPIGSRKRNGPMGWVQKITRSLNCAGARVAGIVFFIGTLAYGAYGNDGLTLEQRWSLEKSQTFSGMTQETLQSLSGKHVLFISGIMNGWANVPHIASYYAASMDVVRNELGVDASYFGPPSWLSIPDGADLVYREILRIHDLVKKPLVLIAHSKGGAEALYAILRHPLIMLKGQGVDEVEPIVDRVVLIQAAIGGSVLASAQRRSLSVHALAWFLGAALDSLSPTQAIDNFASAFTRFNELLKARYGDEGEFSAVQVQKEISDKVYYVRGGVDPSHFSRGLQVVLWVCGGSFDCKQSDGLLDVESQRLSIDGSFGVDLGIIPLDHIQATVSGYLSGSPESDRRALMRAVLQQIYQFPM